MLEDWNCLNLAGKKQVIQFYFKKLLCKLGFHKFKKVTTITWKDQSKTNYYRCKCGAKTIYSWNPNGRSGENDYDDRRGSNAC